MVERSEQQGNRGWLNSRSKSSNGVSICKAASDGKQIFLRRAPVWSALSPLDRGAGARLSRPRSSCGLWHGSCSSAPSDRRRAPQRNLLYNSRSYQTVPSQNLSPDSAPMAWRRARRRGRVQGRASLRRAGRRRARAPAPIVHEYTHVRGTVSDRQRRGLCERGRRRRVRIGQRA
jgi:hypothetical protein